MKRAILTVVLCALSLPAVSAPAIAEDDASSVKSIISEGEKEAKAGRWNKASQAFLEACSKDPSNVVALHDLAVAYAHTGKLEEAADCEIKALAINESYIPAHVELGWILGKQKKYNEAREHLSKALALDPQNSAARKNLDAVNMERQGKVAQADRLQQIVNSVEEAVQSPISQATETAVSKALITRGTMMFRQGKTDVARRLFEQAIASCPTSAVAHASLGVILGTTGDIDGEIKEQKSAHDLDNKNTTILCNLAWAFAQKGDLDSALTNYQKALNLDPKCIDAQVGQGIVLFRQNKLEASIALLKEVVRTNPDAAKAHLGLGAVLQGAGRNEEAIAELESAAKLAPANIEAKTRLAAAYLTAENYGKSIEHYRLLVERFPNDPELRIGLGLALTKTDDISGALIQFRRALELDRNLAAAHACLSMVQEMKGKLEAARESAEMAARVDNTYRDVAQRLAASRNNIDM
ncbi:MAG: tetratricopeptide repeat protein [Candidatus Obscuribacterales bacterium]|jgi:tetratricopeptide (TPR) repeat protein|nr:tetratricopeptide repeat protein [Candidatus Obscuribacterales bacterium]